MSQLDQTELASSKRRSPLETAAVREAFAENAADAVADSQSPVGVFEANTSSEGEIVKGMLEAEGIAAVFESLPGMTMVLGGDFNGTVFVPAEDEAKARELIAAYSSDASGVVVTDDATAGVGEV